jgi:hypothetical protein
MTWVLEISSDLGFPLMAIPSMERPSLDDIKCQCGKIGKKYYIREVEYRLFCFSYSDGHGGMRDSGCVDVEVDEFVC